MDFIKIENKIFDVYENGEEIEGENMANKKYNSKNVHLYIILCMCKRPLGATVLNLSIIANEMNIKSNRRNLENLKERLFYLEKENFIKIDKSIMDLGKNDLFNIEIITDKKETFTKFYKWDVKLLKLLTTSDIVVYYTLRRYYNEKIKKSWISIERISNSLGMSRNTVMTSIRKLKSIKLIEIYNPRFVLKEIDNTIRRSNNEYRFLEPCDEIEELIEKYNYSIKNGIPMEEEKETLDKSNDESKKELDLSDYNVCPF